MMNTLKTAALALTLVVATAGTSFAAQYAYVEHNAKVKQYHKQSSDSVNWIQEGQKVKIIGSWNNWYKIQIPGKDGWVKEGVLDFGNNWNNNNGPVDGFCINGDQVQFCLSSN